MTQSPERSEIRAATFLAFQARLDAPGRSRTGKTRRTPKCNPPNKLCGSRCMPAEWDCRLKGEGTDNHLRAATTDPVGGAASIERGVRRIIKGVKKGSVAEVDAGRRAIVRGVVKATPGTLQDKKDKQKQLLKRTGLIVGVTAALAGGIAAHRSLSKIPFYKQRVYDPFNRSAFNAFGRVMDTSESAVMGVVRRFDPSALGPRENVRLRARQSASGIARSLSVANTSSPEALVSQMTTSGAPLPRIATETDYSAAISQHISSEVRNAQRTPRISHKEWLRESTRGLFGIEYTVRGRVNHSIYSEAATRDFVNNAFDLSPQLYRNATPSRLQMGLRDRIWQHSEALQNLARQRGVNLSDEAQLTAFTQTYIRERTAEFPYATRRQASDVLSRYLGHTRTSAGAEATALIKNTRTQFDDFYRRTATELNLPTRLEGAGRDRAQLLRDAELVHARRVARTMNQNLTVPGPSAGVVINKAFFNTQVRGVNSFAITDREALTAASEWAGTNVTSTAEAFRIIQQQPGLTWAVPSQESRLRTFQRDQRRNPNRPIATDLTGVNFNRGVNVRGETRPQTRAQAVAALQRMKSADGELIYATPEAAQHAYDQAHLRGDSLSPRVRAFLETQRRLDLVDQRLGKPCGRSFISKGHKCGQSTAGSSSVPNTPQPAATKPRQSVATPANTIAAIATVGTIAGGLALAKNPKLRQRAQVQAKLIVRGSDKAVRKAFVLGGRGTIAGLSLKQVKQGLDRLPTALQEPARKLVGGAKTAAAALSLKAEGYQVQDIDVVNNFSTWKNREGTLVSVGSYGDSLVTYVSTNSHKWNGKNVYKIGFNVDQTYDATRAIPTDQARNVTGAVRRMTDNHLTKINDGILATFPWDGDEYGSKRRAIYARAGFNNIPGEASQWALVQKGRIKKMSGSESFIFLADAKEQNAPIYKPTKQEKKDGKDLTVTASSELSPRVRAFLETLHKQAESCPA